MSEIITGAPSPKEEKEGSLEKLGAWITKRKLAESSRVRKPSYQEIVKRSNDRPLIVTRREAKLRPFAQARNPNGQGYIPIYNSRKVPKIIKAEVPVIEVENKNGCLIPKTWNPNNNPEMVVRKRIATVKGYPARENQTFLVGPWGW